jgi:hypothetical protein
VVAGAFHSAEEVVVAVSQVRHGRDGWVGGMAGPNTRHDIGVLLLNVATTKR